MSTTARLALPYIAPQQAQKQVTYNEAMAMLDRLVQPSVKSRTTTAPPGGPTEGDSYIVAPSASGAWAGKDGKLATWLDGGWEYLTPGAGWLAFIEDSAEIAVFGSGAWATLIATDTFEQGTWTPILQFGGAGTGIAYASHSGRYTRIGRQVTITARVTLTSKGSAMGPAKIVGLPFASLNDGLPASLAVGFAANLTGVAGAVLGEVDANATSASLYQSAGGAASALTDAEFTNTANFAFSASYDAA